MDVIGAVYKSGMALPNTIEEVKSLIRCVENVAAAKFVNEPIAYIAMTREYENQGARKKALLPAPKLEDLSSARFFSTEPFADIAERNKQKNRWFTLWSFTFYGIFNNIDVLVNTFFLPDSDFVLREVDSPDEAVNDIFIKYANLTFPLYSYCGGVPLPMLTQQFSFNVLVKAPYSQYLATNCVLPQNLHGLLPENFDVNTGTMLEIAGVTDKDGVK